MVTNIESALANENKASSKKAKGYNDQPKDMYNELENSINMGV